MRLLTQALLLERPATACRYGLPTDGAAVRAWLDPMGVWGARLAAAVATRGRELYVARAGGRAVA